MLAGMEGSTHNTRRCHFGSQQITYSQKKNNNETSILRRMSTEWRSNAGLRRTHSHRPGARGLCWFFASVLLLRSSKSGCDVEGVFTASIVYMGKDSVPVEQHRSDLDALVNHFKSKPEVLHVGYGNNSDPTICRTGETPSDTSTAKTP